MNEQSQQIEYRSVSKTAIVAMLIALPGALSLLVPQLLFLSFFAIGMSLLALWRMQNAEVESIGVGLAVCALFISLFCVSNLVARYTVHSRRLTEEARGHAEAFFDLLAQNELYKAHQLMLPENERVRQGGDLVAYYRTAKAADPLEGKAPGEMKQEAFDAPALKRLLEFLQQDKRPTFVRSLGVDYQLGQQMVRMEYRMDRADDVFMVIFRRRIDEESGESTWQFWMTATKDGV